MRPRKPTVTPLVLLVGLAWPTVSHPQPASDSAAVRRTALDYIQGWYEADAARMERAIHPELAKRLHVRPPGSERAVVQHTGASALVAGTAAGGGSDTPAAARRDGVEILDIFRGAASVKVDATDWVDYLHLVRTEGGWKVLNVLWELREPPAGGGSAAGPEPPAGPATGSPPSEPAPPAALPSSEPAPPAALPSSGSAPPAARGPFTGRRCPVSAAERVTVTAVLAHWAERRRRLTDVPGMALGLVCGSDWAWTAGFGLADREAGLPATDTTRFRIASITKLFTALAVMQLRDGGRLALDDPVAEHLPWFAPRNADRMPPVTLRHLLTHTSGLPTNSAATDFNRMTQPTASEAIAALPSQSLVAAPGARFKYSNLGFAVLGGLIQAASGVRYAHYLEAHLLEPLGLGRTVAHPRPDDPQAAGYHARQPDRPRRRADFIHLAFFTPAGGMASTATDMTRFLRWLLSPEANPGVLDPETVREMRRVHHRVGARGGSGLAWGVEREDGTHRVYHGGGLPTQTSHLLLDLEAGVGAIVLTNAEDAEPAAYAEEALALLRLAAGAAEDGGRAGEDGSRDERPGGEADVAHARGAPGGPSYAGRYRWEDREAWVVPLGGSLWIVAPAWFTDPTAGRPSRSATRLEPLGDHRFRLDGQWGGGEAAEFVLDESTGAVIRLRMPALVYHRVGPVPETGAAGSGAAARGATVPGGD